MTASLITTTGLITGNGISSVNGNALAATTGTNFASGGGASINITPTGNNGSNGYVELQSYYAGIGYTTPLILQRQGGSVLINTTTNANNDKLVVNGSASISGNITRSGYQTTDSQLKIGALEYQSFALNNAWIGENTYYDGTSFKYRNTGAGGLFYFYGNEGQFRFVTSGTAGTTATNLGQYNQLKINADGSFAVGPQIVTTPGIYTGYKFLVDGSGNGTFTGNLSAQGTRIQLGNTTLPGTLWSSYTNALQFGRTTITDASSGNEFAIAANAFYNGTNVIYSNTGFASIFNMNGANNGITLTAFPSGAAGSTLTGGKIVQISSNGGGAVGMFTTVPSTLNNSNPFLFLGQSLVLIAANTGNDNYIGNNFYSNGTNNVYKNTGFASYLGLLATGDLVYGTSPSGTAGSTVTSTEAFRVSQTRAVSIGGSPIPSTYNPNNYPTLFLGNGVGINGSNSDNSYAITVNGFWNGTNLITRNTGAVSQFGGNNNGDFTWNTAPSTTGGTAVSTSQKMILSNAGNLTLGNPTPTLTASPVSIDLGATYSNSAGNNLKLKLYSDGTSINGLGMSGNSFDYVAATGTIHNWYIGGTKYFTVGVNTIAQNSTIPGTLSSSNISHFIGQPLNIVAGNSANYSAFQNNVYNNGTNDVRKNTGFGSDLFFDTNGGINIRTAGTSTSGSTISWTNALQISNAANFAFNSTFPGTLASTVTYMFLGNTGNIYGQTSGTGISIGNNIYYNGTNNIYKTSAIASVYDQDNNGNHIWSTAQSGTAGATVTLSQRMILSNAGNLGVGTTPPGNASNNIRYVFIGQAGSFGSGASTNGMSLNANFYYNGINDVRINAGYATQFTQTAAGDFQFQTAGTSTAGSTISWATPLIISNTGNATLTGNITSSQYRLSALNTAPASATDTGTLGEVRITSSFIYVCTAINTWVRAALSTW